MVSSKKGDSTRSAGNKNASGNTDNRVVKTLSSSKGKPSLQSHTEATTNKIQLDDLHNLLRNSRRRQTLRYLFTAGDGTAIIGELSEHIAAIENDTDPSLVSSKQRKRVYISLYQTHLPHLATLGVIEYERSRGTVTLLDKAEQVKPHLSMPDTEASWRRWLGVIFIICCVILLVFISAYYSIVAAAISLLATASAYIGVTHYL